ncbi:hypothetical protein [Psychrobacter sp. Sarcosine-3u-12]|uniref:hypothetical protein n=1 Tax=Psychrobacter sp. Sarcosine-3u-12 TaxID=2058325 RepID=UPI0012FF51E7|nr:hypothetical protein [Psychrobacter sp. Sarcosine-3u-12]
MNNMTNGTMHGMMNGSMMHGMGWGMMAVCLVFTLLFFAILGSVEHSNVAKEWSYETY